MKVSSQLEFEFDDRPDRFWDFERNYFEISVRTERGRSRDWCTRSYLKFHGSYLFLVWPDNIYYGIDVIIITATLTYVDRFESRFFIQGGSLFLLGVV